MRRENRNKAQYNVNKTIYIIGIIMLLAIATFVITFILYSNKLDNDLYTLDSEYLAQYTNERKENIIEEASSSIGKTIEESKESVNTITIDHTTENNNTTTENKKEESNTLKNKNKTEKDPIFVKPVEGEILKEFAKDSLIYSETLKEWTTHLGVDIKAEKASVVKSAADGQVKYIKNDPRYGLTIIIEHSNGFRTLYANLLTTEFVSEGEEVKSGQTIGTVGDSSVYEIVDESHLHFEILKNDENVNPSDYINFR